MVGYSVEIRETSMELTAKERIMIKDTTDAIKLDQATKEGAIIIQPRMFAILDIHNEKSDNKDYQNYIIQDMNGEKYVTGSDSFWSSFMDIYNEMKEETEEWAIKVYRRESNNYKGKDFITCSIQ